MALEHLDTKVDLIINRMTRAIYKKLQAQGEISENEIYMIEDDILNACGQRILSVGSPISADDAATKGYVDAALSGVELSGYAKVGSLFKTVSMIKPYSENRLFCEITASMSADFAGAMSADSAVSPGLFKGFASGGESSEWQVQPASGFPTSFNDRPVAFDLERLLAENGRIPADGDLVYVKYRWYWADGEGARHRSDEYSAIVPTGTEVGANAHDVASRREFGALASYVVPDTRSVGPDAEYPSYYRLRLSEFSRISAAVRNGDRFLLDGYDVNGDYRVQLSTAAEAGEISVQFCVDLGNGPEVLPGMAINRNSFMPGSEYVVEIKHDSIVVDRINGQDVVKYLKDNSNSVTLRTWNI